jgi:hypothetical protein
MKTDALLFNNHPMDLHGVELTRTRMHYPYLLDLAFNFRDGQFNPSSLEILLRYYCTMVLEGYESDAKGIGKLIEAVNKTAFDENHFPDGLLGNNRLRFMTTEGWKHECSIFIGLSRTEWKLRRFGDCLGIRPVAIGRNNDELHEDSVRVLERVLTTDGNRYFFPFYRRVSVETRRYFRDFDMEGELSDLRRYIPSIKWTDDATRLRKDLVEDFIGNHKSMNCGVPVGSYFGLPIYAKLLWKRDADGQAGDHVRRRGIIAPTDDAVIWFHGSHTDFSMVYFVETSDDETYRFGEEIDHSIEFLTEQRVMENASRVLYAGLVELEYQNLVKRNPDWIRMRAKQSE